ncbi:MAG: HPr family phosphocarrier protein [Acidobacteria bacterium]|nr:HPr family phosphocarrier protein [Acidobacteriota bacterium]
MLETQVRVVNELGLHARAAAQLVRKAATFKSRITLTRLDRNITANAKSILSVLYIAAALGTELVLEAEGPDESEALIEISELFAAGFGEIQ